MAPKRTSDAKAHPAKKAKIVVPEALILEFIAKCQEVPKPCREMLQVSVPICFEVVESNRHKFQVKVLDQVAKLLAGRESVKRRVVTDAEGELAKMKTDQQKAAADVASAKAAADAKQAECDKEGKVVDAAREKSNNSSLALKEAQKAAADFDKKKVELFMEQDNFNKLMTEIFERLKNDKQLSNGRQRNKFIAELQGKLSEVGAQESLVDALASTLKMAPEKRAGTFAKATIGFAQEYFDKHKAKVAQDIASLDAEEAGHRTAVTREEAAAVERRAALECVEKDWDGMQEVWIGLDKIRAEAARGEKLLENQIVRAQEAIDKAQADLEKFMQVPTLFAELKEKSTTAAADEPEPEQEQDDAEGKDAQGEKPDEAMQDMQAEIRQAMHADA